MPVLIYNLAMMLEEEIYPLEPDMVDLTSSNLELLQAHCAYNVELGVHIDLVAEYHELDPEDIYVLLYLFGYYYREGVH